MFFYKVEGHMLKLSSFGRGKKFRPKKSLTSLLHAALQLFPVTSPLNTVRVLVLIFPCMLLSSLAGVCAYMYAYRYVLPVKVPALQPCQNVPAILPPTINIITY